MGVEHIKELVNESIRNVQEDDPTLLSSGRVKLVGELPGTLMLDPFCEHALALAVCRALLLKTVVPSCVDAFHAVARNHRLTKHSVTLT